MSVNIIWFRHGLRLHDNPALLEALSDKENGIQLLPIFIFDGESAGTKSVGFNRLNFLLDSLKDINDQLLSASLSLGRLYLMQGKPVQIFQSLHKRYGINKLCFEQDCEPIWNRRDNAVKKFCHDSGIKCIERISHTLWNPKEIIDTNGGIPPLTYQMFLHTVQVIGLPPRPVPDPDWENVDFIKLSEDLIKELKVILEFPTPEYFQIYPDSLSYLAKAKWLGGETEALLLLQQRLKVEENAFRSGCYLPNQAKPNIVESSKSMSPYLRFGCLSVRKFYWDVHDLFRNVQQQAVTIGLLMPAGAYITGQLIWREYFYTMSVNNINYDRIEDNKICLNIPWARENHQQLQLWTQGKTGFPLIDAAMRQLLAEGWLHHTLRNVVATFVTRGGLWQSWEHGVKYFLKYLLDADWSVCAGNWMWISSSAFEGLLDTFLVACPVALGKRLDPMGQYVKQYLPELAKVPKAYIHEPWRMPNNVQEESNCIIGIHYPERLIDLNVASQNNMQAMRNLRNSLLGEGASTEEPPHCRPSNEEEIRNFFWLAN